MKHTSKDLSNTKKSYTVSLDEAELKKAKDHAVKRLAKTVKVQGFRQGNVPEKVAEKHIDPMQLANETLETAINAALNDIVVEDDLRVLDRPSIDVKEFEPFTHVEFVAEIEVLGDMKLGDYKKLTAKKQVESVTKEEVDQVITRMQEGFADKNEVERAAKEGDEVIIDFEGKDEKAEPVEGAKGNDYTLRLGSGTFIPGFEEKIIGHKAGEEFDIDVTFPKDYYAEHLKGAKVTFAINLKKVFEVNLPKVDDEFAKKVGPFDTAKDLSSDIKRELASQKDKTAEDKYKDDLLGELVEESDIPTPAVLIHDQLHALEQEMTQNLMYRGMTIEQYVEAEGYKDKEEWREKELQPAAERRVKSGLVLAELSKVLAVEVTQEELDARLAQQKAEAPKMADQLDSPEARRDLSNRVITEKTLAKLIEINAKKK